MKLERINEKQIRCTLSGTDLRDRHVSLFELAYGGEKARVLFREMLEQADSEFNFRTGEFPLMIEAVPLPGEGLSVIITKLDDPDELDTRFAKFAPVIEEAYNTVSAGGPEAAGSAQDIFDALSDLIAQAEETGNGAPADVPADITPVYSFSSVESLMEAAAVLRGVYTGENSLYKNPRSRKYLLTVHRTLHTPEEFNRICNILTEYGQKIRSNQASEEYFREHLRLLIPGNALQTLAGNDPA